MLILLGSLALTSCEDESIQTRLKNRSEAVQVFTEKLYALPPAPKVETPPVQTDAPVITPVEFPEPYPLMREQHAKQLRGKRLDAARAKVQSTALPDKPANFRYQDEDYQAWERPLPEDKSTFPVDRSRILTADMRIGAILEDNINSQIAGRVIVIVDRDVLSPNGKFILLPAYTRVICQYEGLEQTGETRLPLVCMRAIRPDGASLLLTKAIASDQMGRTGLIGTVDNRTFERYGAAFIISGISALAQGGVQQTHFPGLNASVNALSNNLGQVTAEVIKQNIDLRPIISIAAGSRIQLIPQTDMVFRKPVEEQEKS